MSKITGKKQEILQNEMTQFENKFVNQIITGDCLEVMKHIPNNTIDSIICDPPYGLGFMGKEWDTFSQEHIKRLTKGYEVSRIKKLARGIERTTGINSPATNAGLYDHSRNAEFQQWFTVWATEVLRIAKPGAMMLVFGGTRTYHRLTCAIEDAGWLIRDCVMWLYGSGFPKSLNISKAIQKTKGVKPLKTEPASGVGFMKPDNKDWHVTKHKLTMPTATGLAEFWNGYGTALKPAWEPILVAMKPLDGTFAANAEKWGVAGLNIDGGRIKHNEPCKMMKAQTDKAIMTGNGKVEQGGRHQDVLELKPQGRWPANVILDEEAAAMLDEQSGESKSTDRIRHNKQSLHSGKYGIYGKFQDKDTTGFADSGGASRFFYCAKASRAERNAGLEEMEKFSNPKRGKEKRLTVGGGQEIALPRQNTHPTVKPLKLMEYLCNLTKTPTGGIVLDCFAGSGTTGMACINTGRDYISIEKDPDYCKIAEKRIEYARKQRKGQMALFERE